MLPPADVGCRSLRFFTDLFACIRLRFFYIPKPIVLYNFQKRSVRKKPYKMEHVLAKLSKAEWEDLLPLKIDLASSCKSYHYCFLTQIAPINKLNTED